MLNSGIMSTKYVVHHYLDMKCTFPPQKAHLLNALSKWQLWQEAVRWKGSDLTGHGWVSNPTALLDVTGLLRARLIWRKQAVIAYSWKLAPHRSLPQPPLLPATHCHRFRLPVPHSTEAAATSWSLWDPELTSSFRLPSSCSQISVTGNTGFTNTISKAATHESRSSVNSRAAVLGQEDCETYLVFQIGHQKFSTH